MRWAGHPMRPHIASQLASSPLCALDAQNNHPAGHLPLVIKRSEGELHEIGRDHIGTGAGDLVNGGYRAGCWRRCRRRSFGRSISRHVIRRLTRGHDGYRDRRSHGRDRRDEYRDQSVGKHAAAERPESVTARSVSGVCDWTVAQLAASERREGPARRGRRAGGDCRHRHPFAADRSRVERFHVRLGRPRQNPS
jgi:hypothetical protein